MKALICDRCKKSYIGDNKRGERKYTLRTIGTEVVRKQMSRGIPLDLCDDCYESLMKWLEMKSPYNFQVLRSNPSRSTNYI